MHPLLITYLLGHACYTIYAFATNIARWQTDGHILKLTWFFVLFAISATVGILWPLLLVCNFFLWVFKRDHKRV